MRNVSNIRDQKLIEDQMGVLSEIIAGIKTKNDASTFLNGFLTESERLYLGQRMNIMRMLIKEFSYMQIREKIKAQNATITKSKEIIDDSSAEFINILAGYRYKKDPKEEPKMKLPKYKGFPNILG